MVDVRSPPTYPDIGSNNRCSSQLDTDDPATLWSTQGTPPALAGCRCYMEGEGAHAHYLARLRRETSTYDLGRMRVGESITAPHRERCHDADLHPGRHTAATAMHAIRHRLRFDQLNGSPPAIDAAGVAAIDWPRDGPCRLQPHLGPGQLDRRAMDRGGGRGGSRTHG